MYNAERYIAKCIESVLNQDEKDFELIIIDDGSKDNSYSIVEEYSKRDSRIKLIHQPNKGVFHTRCFAIEKASGQYIVFLDADDTLKKHALKRLKEIFTGNQIDIIIYRAETFSESGKMSKTNKVFENNAIFEGEVKKELYKKILMGTSINAMVFKAIRASCFDLIDLNGYPKISMSDDLLHTLRPLTNAKKIIYIDDILYNYRITNTSMTRRFDPDTFNCVKFVHKKLFTYLSEWKMNSDSDIHLFYLRFLKGIGSIVLFSPSNIKGNEKEYVVMLNTIHNDDLFKEAYKRAYDSLPLISKVPIWLIKRRKYQVLLKIKPIVTMIRQFK
jgi:glycosyltransferase involved in cell wall biosynthesis